jgi:hypothetical protein
MLLKSPTSGKVHEHAFIRRGKHAFPVARAPSILSVPHPAFPSLSAVSMPFMKLSRRNLGSAL